MKKLNHRPLSSDKIIKILKRENPYATTERTQTTTTTGKNQTTTTEVKG